MKCKDEKYRKSEIVCIRISKQLKEEMNKLDVNWSEYLRKAIEEKIRKEKMKKIWKELKDLQKSVIYMGVI